MTWSDLPGELLHDMIDRLEVADVIRSEAACTGWWSSIRREYYSKSNIPWLMLSSSDDDKINYRYFYSLIEHKIYKFHLAEIAGQHCVGSSRGYLFSVDENADLIVTSPFAGATCIALPPTSTFPSATSVVRDDSSGRIIQYTIMHDLDDPSVTDYRSVEHMRDHYHRKAILSPDADIAVVMHGGDSWLAFCRLGDQLWTALETSTMEYFDDLIFHKGRLHAIDFMGTIVIFDLDRPSDPPFVSPQGPIKGNCGQRRYLVESPDGENLFLVYRQNDYRSDISRTKNFSVYILDETTYTWKHTNTLGEIALFLGFNYSTSFCIHGLPGIKRNCIYFTDDYKESYIHEPKAAGDKGVFNLEDGSLELVYSDKKLDQLNWPPPTWFIPTLL